MKGLRGAAAPRDAYTMPCLIFRGRRGQLRAWTVLVLVGPGDVMGADDIAVNHLTVAGDGAGDGNICAKT